MANSYCGFSAILPVPKEKIDKLEEIINTLLEEMEEDNSYIGCDAVVVEDGVWFSEGEDAGEPEHVAKIAKHIIETLQLPEPFYFNYAFWCDKARLDNFGGGAFVVRLGKETIWCTPERELRKQVLNERDAKEYYYTLTGASDNITLKSIGLDGSKKFVWENRVMDMCKVSGIYPEEEFILKIQGDDKTWYEKYTDGTLVMMGENSDIELCNSVGDTQEAP